MDDSSSWSPRLWQKTLLLALAGKLNQNQKVFFFFFTSTKSLMYNEQHSNHKIICISFIFPNVQFMTWLFGHGHFFITYHFLMFMVRRGRWWISGGTSRRPSQVTHSTWRCRCVSELPDRTWRRRFDTSSRSWSGRQPMGWAPQVGPHRRYFFWFLEV